MPSKIPSYDDSRLQPSATGRDPGWRRVLRASRFGLRLPSAGGFELEAIDNRQRVVRVEIRRLMRFTSLLRKELGLGAESIAIRLVTDAEMAKLNETYRSKRGTTDVLSFPSEQRGRPANLPAHLKNINGVHLGDIAVSPLVAKRNAKTYGRSLSEELEVLILHGVLHLLGYDHNTDRGEMNRVEMRLRRRLGIA